MEKPYNGRAIINEGSYGLGITIPTKKNWFLIIFLGAWLCGWVSGEISAIKSFITADFIERGIGSVNLFMLFFNSFILLVIFLLGFFLKFFCNEPILDKNKI